MDERDSSPAGARPALTDREERALDESSEGMPDGAEIRRADVDTSPVCALIRTKMVHVLGRIDRQLMRSSPQAQYWCLRTMLDFGPDGELACPEECRATSGRSCYADD